MMRCISALAITLAAILLPLAPFGPSAHASGGIRNLQTVALRRQDCTTTAGPAVGTARFSLDDQGGIPGGVEIDVALTAGLARSTYSVFVLATPCQVLAQAGMLKTDDRGRGDLSVHVSGTILPAGASLRVQVVSPSTAPVPGPGPFVDVLTSDPASGL